MSEDIRMSDVFDLPSFVDQGEEDHLFNIVHDDGDWCYSINIEGIDNELEAKAVCEAINQHDKLTDRVKELEEVLAAAIDFIEKSPCDPDITPDQAEAWLKLDNLSVKELLK